MNEHYNNYCDYTDCAYCFHHICDCKNDIKCKREKDKEAIMNMINNNNNNNNKMAKDYKGIISAIRSGRLNCDKHADGMPFRWYGRELVITPYFVSYGQGGYDIEDTSLNTYLQYDFDIQPKFTVFDKNDKPIYSEKD